MERSERRAVGVSLVDGDEMEEEEDVPVTTCDLRFDSHGYWVERRNNVDPTGLVSTRTIRYTPIGNGKLRVEMSDGMYAECKVEMVEMSPYLLITTAVNAHTGKPVLVESVTILDNTRRVRTIQDFSSVGNMTDVYVINEKRVLDPSAQSDCAPTRCFIRRRSRSSCFSIPFVCFLGNG